MTIDNSYFLESQAEVEIFHEKISRFVDFLIHSRRTMQILHKSTLNSNGMEVYTECFAIDIYFLCFDNIISVCFSCK